MESPMEKSYGFYVEVSRYGLEMVNQWYQETIEKDMWYNINNGATWNILQPYNFVCLCGL